MLLTTARSDRSYSSMLRLMSASMPEARLSSVWCASCSSPRRMSSITLAQIAEKPSTATTDDAISHLADNRQARPASLLRRQNTIHRSQCIEDASAIVAAGLNDDTTVLVS